MADLSFIGDQYALRTQPQDVSAPDESNPADAVNALLKTLETARPPEPHKLKTWQTVLGSLGDALQSAAAVRAGGGPLAVGPFAARQNQERQLYQQQTLEADTSNRDLRNKVRIGAFEEGMRAKREKEVAGIRKQNRPLRFVPSTIDIDGTPTRVVDVYDPGTGEYLGRSGGGGEAGYSPYVLPAIPGVQGAQIVPRSGGGGAKAIGPTPPAPPSVERDYRKNQAFITGSNHLREAFRTLKKATAGRGKIGEAVGQELGESKYGGAIPYSAANNAFENELRTNLDTMIVAVTGLSFPEQAFRRYRAELPIATDSEAQAMTKIDNVVRKFISEQKSMEQAYPEVGGGQGGAPEKDRAEQLIDEILGGH